MENSKTALDLARSLRDALDIVGPQGDLREVRTAEGIALTFDLAELAARRRIEQVQLSLDVANGTGAGTSSANATLTADYLITQARWYYSGTQAFTNARVIASFPQTIARVHVGAGGLASPEQLIAVLTTPFAIDSNVPRGDFTRFPLYLPQGTTVYIYWTLPAASDGVFSCNLFGWRQKTGSSGGVLWPRMV